MAFLGGLIHPGDVVWDVGAHYGYVALMVARGVGAEGRLHAFEPARRSRWYLSRHVAWNGLTNVVVHPFALSDFDGQSSFGGGDSSQMFALGGGDERVLVRRGDGLVQKGVSPPPTFVKVDVEGAEAAVLRGLIDVLKPATRLFVAMHSRDAYRECVELMRGVGFAAHPSAEVERAARASAWSGDPDVFFVGPGYRGTDQDLRMLEAAGF
jgi:FkbM family methyltransferase